MTSHLNQNPRKGTKKVGKSLLRTYKIFQKKRKKSLKSRNESRGHLYRWTNSGLSSLWPVFLWKGTLSRHLVPCEITWQSHDDHTTGSHDNHMTRSHDQVTWPGHTTRSHDQITWPGHMTRSHDQVTWQTYPWASLFLKQPIQNIHNTLLYWCESDPNPPLTSHIN